MPIAFDSAPADEQAPDLIEVRPYYNPERRTPVNIVPGLMGVILMMTMMLFTAVAIVRERERGNLELLINTPVSSAELMIGKVIPYIVIGLFQLALFSPSVSCCSMCRFAAACWTCTSPAPLSSRQIFAWAC